jgi:hypothetical protein
MNMNKKRTATKKAVKKTAKKNAKRMTPVTTNIDQYISNGNYRARKYVDGTRISATFTKLKDAKAFLKNS